MTYTTWFLVCLGLTVMVVLLTLRSGLKKERGQHLIRALSSVVLLAITVVFAYLMGEYEKEFPAGHMRVHRFFSLSVAGVVPLVALSGAVLWRRPNWRNVHRTFVVLFLCGAAGATVTGIWMLAVSSPK